MFRNDVKRTVFLLPNRNTNSVKICYIAKKWKINDHAMKYLISATYMFYFNLIDTCESGVEFWHYDILIYHEFRWEYGIVRYCCFLFIISLGCFIFSLRGTLQMMFKSTTYIQSFLCWQFSLNTYFDLKGECWVYIF